jgi:hypothetical protein
MNATEGLRDESGQADEVATKKFFLFLARALALNRSQ